MPLQLNDIIQISANDTDIVSIDCTPYLDPGELVASVNSASATGLTIDNLSVNIVALTIKGVTVEIGHAIQFRVAGATAGTTYTVVFNLTTDSNPARTAERQVLICAY